jgi:hypothetical protein
LRSIIYIGIFGGLLALFGCDNSKKGKISTKTSSRQDTTINVNNILFTTPTIENTFPSFEEIVDSSNLSIPEDDWRQVEFVSKSQQALIDAEIDSITYIFQHKVHQGPSYSGFKEIYVRRLIVQPISIPYHKILGYLGQANSKKSGLIIDNNPGQVKNGFSLICDGVEYYGLKDSKNNVTTFCIYGANSDEDLDKSIKNLSKFLRSEELFLVHWTHSKVFNEANIPELVADFETK